MQTVLYSLLLYIASVYRLKEKNIVLCFLCIPVHKYLAKILFLSTIPVLNCYLIYKCHPPKKKKSV